MINLNLLPRATKKQIAKNIRYIALVNNMILLSIILVMVSVLLIVNDKYLTHQVSKIDQIAASNLEEGQVMEINSKMKQAEVIQKDYVKWSRVMSNLLKLIPQGNSLEYLEINKDNQTILIKGRAEKRDDFLKLKEQLENSDLITDVESPISNLLYRENIDFTLEGQLNL